MFHPKNYLWDETPAFLLSSPFPRSYREGGNIIHPSRQGKKLPNTPILLQLCKSN